MLPCLATKDTLDGTSFSFFSFLPFFFSSSDYPALVNISFRLASTYLRHQALVLLLEFYVVHLHFLSETSISVFVYQREGNMVVEAITDPDKLLTEEDHRREELTPESRARGQALLEQETREREVLLEQQRREREHLLEQEEHERDLKELRRELDALFEQEGRCREAFLEQQRRERETLTQTRSEPINLSSRWSRSWQLGNSSTGQEGQNNSDSAPPPLGGNESGGAPLVPGSNDTRPGKNEHDTIL